MIKLASTFSVIDSHTAGHPTRVILSGVPKLSGDSVLAKRDYFRNHHDRLRGALLHEPRGHAAMVGLVPCDSAVADFGAFFISSYVYLDMCGHGTIGYARTLAATGQISPATGDSFTLETPAGVVTVGLVWGDDGNLHSVRVRNVATRVGAIGLKVPDDDGRLVSTDLIHGGMWYALVDAASVGLVLVPDNVGEIMRRGSALKARIRAAVEGRPEFAGAAAPSVLFYEERSAGEAVHMLVLESNKFDRSPCGTGTSARLAQLLMSGRLGRDDTYTARNIFGVPFLARAVEVLGEGEIVAEIEGSAYLMGFSTLLVEQDDPVAAGFLCR